jgi:RNA polymerase sigma factor (sigma-70 family)
MFITQENFHRTYATHFNKILNFLKLKCQNSSDAEDLAQESFVKLWQHREKIEQGKETSFLYTIAFNLFIDKKRKEAVSIKYQRSVKQNHYYESPEFTLLYNEYHTQVQQKIAALPDNARQVFLMNKVEKMTYAEIAEVIGLSVKSVEKRMAVALKVYRELRRM